MAINPRLFNLLPPQSQDESTIQIAASSSQQSEPENIQQKCTKRLIKLASRILYKVAKIEQQCSDQPVDVSISQKTNKETVIYSLPFQNKIVLNQSFFEKYANDTYTQVYWIIFERMNVKSKPALKKLYKMVKPGQICKSGLVEQVEKIEHHHALRTQKIMKKAQHKNLISESINDLLLFKDFDTHYKLQQFLGHSQQIGKIFDRLIDPAPPVRFRGTFPIKNDVSEKIKTQVISVFYAKRDTLKNDETGETAKRCLGLKIIYAEGKSRMSSEVKAIKALFSEVEFTELRELGLAHLRSINIL